MKKLALAILIFFSGSLASADNEAGFVLGSASGFSGMLDLGGGNAADLGLAWGSDSQLTIYADYLFTNARRWNVRNVSNPLTLYYGLGFRLENINSGKHDGKTSFGPRAPIGLHLEINNPNISFFGELAPVLQLTPESEVEIMVGVGVRIRF